MKKNAIGLAFLCSFLAFGAPIELSEQCLITLNKIPVRFTAEIKKNEVAIAPPQSVESTLVEAARIVDGRNITDPKEYRKTLQKEIARLKAVDRARETLKNDIDLGVVKLPENSAEAQRVIDKEVIRRSFNELRSAEQESILFVDTPVAGADGKTLNSVVPLVIDHHGVYAPKNGLDNSGAQVIQRLMEASSKTENKNPDGSVNSRIALESFRKDLFGEEPGKMILSSNNLADAAEVMAILRNPILQKRIIEDPNLAKMLLESGRFTDFFVFGGDGYEKSNTSPQSQKAIQLSKAIMQSHSDLLAKNGVKFGDRITGLKDPVREKELLEVATTEAEKLLLAATSGDFTRVSELEAKFNRARDEVAVSEAMRMHDAFKSELLGDLRSVGVPNPEELSLVINNITFGNKPVSTGNQFADWGAAPIVNTRQSNRKPIMFELSGNTGSDIGKPVIIAESKTQPVDLRPFASALNAANERAKSLKADLMRREGRTEIEIARELDLVTGFTPRGTGLAFSFGGHLLSRAEISKIVGETLQAEGQTIAPPQNPK